MIAYLCDQCNATIDLKTLKTPPSPDKPLYCTSCSRQQKNSNELLCDGCQTAILPIDLRTQKAIIQENALYCSKCIRKLSRHSQSIRQNHWVQFFIFVCFPLLSAFILFQIFSSTHLLTPTTTPTPTSSALLEQAENPTSKKRITLSTEEVLQLQKEQLTLTPTETPSKQSLPPTPLLKNPEKIPASGTLC
jgi:hypothetical protein